MGMFSRDCGYTQVTDCFSDYVNEMRDEVRRLESEEGFTTDQAIGIAKAAGFNMYCETVWCAAGDIMHAIDGIGQ